MAKFVPIKSNQTVSGNFMVIDPATESFNTQRAWPGTIQVGILYLVCCQLLSYRADVLFFQLMINDGLVVWRACIFWSASTLIQYMIIILMVGDISAYSNNHTSQSCLMGNLVKTVKL